MNPTPPPTDLPTLKANAEAAIVFLKDIGYDGFSNTLRAYLDAMEKQVENFQQSPWQALQVKNDQLRSHIAELERGCQELCNFEAIRNHVKAWRERLDSTGPDYTIEGGGYITESVIEVLEEILANTKPTPTFSGYQDPVKTIDRDITDGVPPEIINAATQVSRWMEHNGHKDWALMDIQSRQSLTFSDALRIAKECFTKHDDTCNLFQEGIQTVINALEAVEKENK